jgi:hypothetical protein
LTFTINLGEMIIQLKPPLTFQLNKGRPPLAVC